MRGCPESSASSPALSPSQAWRWYHPPGHGHLRAPALWASGSLDLGIVGLGRLPLPLQLLPPDSGSALLPQSPFLHPADPSARCLQSKGWVAVVGEDAEPLRSVSSRLLGDRRAPGGRAAALGPRGGRAASSKQHGDGKVCPCPPLPGFLVALKTPIWDPPVPGPQHSGPQELQNAPGPEREGRRPRPPLGPMPSCAHSALHPFPPHALSHPFHHCSLGSKWFPPWPHPHPSGALGRAGTWPPHHSPCPEATMFLLSWCVSPASSPPLPSAARSSCPPVRPAAFFTRLRLTLLGLSLSPLLPPICSSQGCPRASDGPLRLSLCLSVPLSLCLSLSCDLR